MNSIAWIAWLEIMAALGGQNGLAVRSRIIEEPTTEIVSVAWSPDGEGLAIGSEDGSIRLWNLLKCRRIATLDAKSEEILPNIRTLAWSPDSKTLASGSYDRSVRLWNVATGTCVATLDARSDWVSSVAWSPDGNTLISVADGVVQLWDVNAKKEKAVLDIADDYIGCVSWSPDGKVFATGATSGTITIWTADADRPVSSWSAETGEPVLSVGFSPNGDTLASGDGCRVVLWDVSRGLRLRNLDGHSCEFVYYAHGGYGGMYIPAVTSVIFSPDGSTLASASQDKTLRLWSVATGKCIRAIDFSPKSVESMAWNPHLGILASVNGDNEVTLWRTDGIGSSAKSTSPCGHRQQWRSPGLHRPWGKRQRGYLRYW